jgi:hypothetical protein
MDAFECRSQVDIRPLAEHVFGLFDDHATVGRVLELFVSVSCFGSSLGLQDDDAGEVRNCLGELVVLGGERAGFRTEQVEGADDVAAQPERDCVDGSVSGPDGVRRELRPAIYCGAQVGFNHFSSAAPSCEWFAKRPQVWRDWIRWATLDLSGPYRNVFDTMLPDATQVADPFHVVKLAAGDPKGEVKDAWLAYQVVREICTINNADAGAAFVARLAADLQDAAGPPEAINNLVKRVKRTAFGMTRFRNYRLRSLLYAGKPNWSLLNPTPR